MQICHGGWVVNNSIFINVWLLKILQVHLHCSGSWEGDALCCSRSVFSMKDSNWWKGMEGSDVHCAVGSNSNDLKTIQFRDSRTPTFPLRNGFLRGNLEILELLMAKAPDRSKIRASSLLWNGRFASNNFPKRPWGEEVGMVVRRGFFFVCLSHSWKSLSV